MRNSTWLAPLAVAGAAAPAWAEEAGSASPLTVDGGLVIWTLVVFALLLYVLRRSAWPLLLQAVREREQVLERQLADAARAREEAAKLLEEQRQTLARAQAAAQEMLAQAKAVAEKERETLLARAREEYEQHLTRARKDIEEEKAKAILALRREAVDLSIAAASKVLAENLDTEANRRLALDYLATLEQRS
ncbi:MAG TPA: F0F1 ATP synthase subunit B [Gemmatimonadales bacterium]|nr:F0F1 ATP synthase subunit B [Gemmatimonadales bacterium]HYT84503.1 F0F1 ATP synthase subunit B [Gemmatimonadales bacterium]